MTEEKLVYDLTLESSEDETNFSQVEQTRKIERLTRGQLRCTDIDDFMDVIRGKLGGECADFELVDATFFCSKWKTQTRLFKTSLTFFRVYASGHFLLVIANNEEKTFEVKNSMYRLGQKAANTVCTILGKLGYEKAASGKRDRRTSHQQNGVDCGVFVILNILRCLSEKFLHKDVADIRRLMVDLA
jgi:hypothetical protein